MNRIRFLKFYFAKGSSCGEYLSEGLTQFRKELRYLQWEGYPCKSLPLGLCVEFLVDIHRCHGNVEELWQGKRWVNLSGLEKLCHLHESVLSALTVILDNCKALIQFNVTKNVFKYAFKIMQSFPYDNIACRTGWFRQRLLCSQQDALKFSKRIISLVFNFRFVKTHLFLFSFRIWFFNGPIINVRMNQELSS
ncbi:hypothetical protein Ahy_B09g095275 isoform A [Arachis hypogaea]|uniref:Uncharacterized protein n=1 Tax=Arachis hypogaea TaxID=3818 RepID=A0A444XDD8_ARAHY|nr:hypothetical protein Ahy_B09g095275 isoform A [Arachis hypogaea]